MIDNTAEISQKSRMAAQRHVLAFTLACAHKNSPDAEKAIDEFCRSMIAEFIQGADINIGAQGQPELRNRMTAEYTEEMSSMGRLAKAFIKGKRTPD